jgi:hypothetical protein
MVDFQCLGAGRGWVGALCMMLSNDNLLKSLNNETHFHLLETLNLTNGNSYETNPYFTNKPIIVYLDTNNIATNLG